MAPTKMMCLNAAGNGELTYTGKENTPQGLGYSAGAEMVGKMMKGRDGAVYMVIMKNREKTWKKIPEDMAERMQKEMPLLTKTVQNVREAPELEVPVEEAPVDATAEVEVITEAPDAPKEKKARKPRAKKENGEASESVSESSETEAPKQEAPVTVEEKKARKPRAKKEKTPDASSETEAPKEEVPPTVEETEAPKEKKARKPRAKKEVEATKVEEDTETAAPTEEAPKEKKARKPRAKKEKATTEETEAPKEEAEGEASSEEKKARKPRAKKEKVEKDEKKERKPRAPTAYNKFLGEKMTELRASKPGLQNTDYMQMAVAEWKALKAEAEKTTA